ncbi:hypothetical protein BX257_2973 [Streptomyces sp. 3212.3]|nr:hypothetical protein BX257_2973 [Streptomyces sp. 3212.3]
MPLLEHAGGRSSSWQKVRHAETVDADVVRYKGPALRPKALAVRLPNGRTALTLTLAAPIATLVGPHLAASGPAGRATRTLMWLVESSHPSLRDGTDLLAGIPHLQDAELRQDVDSPEPAPASRAIFRVTGRTTRR